MDKEIDEINRLYSEGMQFKDVARKGDEFIDFFFNASQSYFGAAKGVESILEDTDPKKFDFYIRSNALKNYYLYEAYECEYAYNYKNGQYEVALKSAGKAQQHINDAIKIVDESLKLIKSDDVKQFLIAQRKNWGLSKLTVKLCEVEPIGKKAMIEKDYVSALDAYTKMGKLQDEVHDYVKNSELPEVYKRIEKGNYYATKASIAMTIAGVYVAKSSKHNYQKEIIQQLLDALEFIKIAQISNPEQDRYKDGAEQTTKNIIKILNENKSEWLLYLTEFENNKFLIKIMKQTDLENYKLQNAKLEIEKDKPKRFILTFGFLFSALLILGYLMFQIALSEILWYRFLALLISLPVIFTVVGAFALRATDSLKEENFLKLMELAFKMNLKGLKALNDKDAKPEN